MEQNPYESPKDPAQQQVVDKRCHFRLRWVLIPMAVALLLTVGLGTYVRATGIGVPYPEQTKEEAAYEERHWAIALPLFFASAVAWLMAGVAALVWGISAAIRLICRLRSSSPAAIT
jgi:hypothetical protein